MKCRANTMSCLAAAALATVLPIHLVQAAAGDKPAPGTAATKPAGNAGGAASKTPANGIAAEVNNDKIMVADVERLLSAITKSEKTLTANTPQAKEALENWRQRILDNLIVDRLMYQEAVRRKITPDAATVSKVVAQVKGEQTDEEFKKALAQEGLTPQYVQKSITEELMRRELAKQLTADITVSDDEMGKFYREHPKDFTVPEFTRVRHILIAAQKEAPAAEKQKAREKAQGLLKKVQGGDNFEKLARENSDDPGSKEQGGDLGPLEREQFVKPFEDAAFATPVGKIYDKVVESDFGYHIIKTEKVAPRVVPLNDVKTDLKPFLLKNKIQERLDQRITELRNQAKIKKNI